MNDRLEAAATREDRTATIAIFLAEVRPTVEGEVLHRELWMVLVIAVIGRPHLLLIAGVHIKDAGIAAAAQRDVVGAVDRDSWAARRRGSRSGRRGCPLRASSHRA